MIILIQKLIKFIVNLELKELGQAKIQLNCQEKVTEISFFT